MLQLPLAQEMLYIILYIWDHTRHRKPCYLLWFTCCLPSVLSITRFTNCWVPSYQQERPIYLWLRSWRSHDIDTLSALTHCGIVTHLCVSKLTSIGSDNGLSPARRQAIIWTNAGILLIRILGTNFSEIIGKIHSFSFKNMHLKMSSAKGRLFSLGLNELMAHCGQNHPCTGGFPSCHRGPVNLECFLLVGLNKLACKRFNCWWFQTRWRLSCSCDVIIMWNMYIGLYSLALWC